MARGQQKIQSQQKNAERQKKLAKANGPDQKQAAQAKLTFKCSVCMSQVSPSQLMVRYWLACVMDNQGGFTLL